MKTVFIVILLSVVLRYVLPKTQSYIGNVVVGMEHNYKTAKEEKELEALLLVVQSMKETSNENSR